MNSYLSGVVVFLQRSLEEFRNEFEHNLAFEDFLLSFGWRASIQENQISGIRSAFGIFNSLESIVELVKEIERGQADPVAAIEQAITDIKNLFQSVNAFSSSLASGQTLYPLNQSAFWDQMASSLADRIIINGLRHHQYPIFGILHLWGIIRFERVNPSGLGRIPFYQQIIDWSLLGDLLSQPLERLKAEYNWGANTDYNHLFDVLMRVFAVPGSKMERGVVKKAHYDSFFQSFSNPSGAAVPQVTFTLYESYDWEENNKIKVSLGISPAVSSATQQLSGLLLVPNVEGTATFDLPLGPELALYGSGYFESNNFFAYAFHPNESSSTYLNTGSNIPLWGAKINLVLAPVSPWILFGSADATRLELSGLEASLDVKGTATDPELTFSLGIGDYIASPNFQFVFKPSQGDNFLKRLLGDKDFEATFGLGVVWSSKSGISFVGGGGFEIAIPLHEERQSSETVKPLQFDTLRISMGIGNGNFKIGAGVDFTFKIGPVVGVVKGVGASLSLVKKNSNEPRGIFNSLDYKLGFKPPTGIGLSIDAETIKGGGFLNFDETTSTYTGALELTFSKISLKAIGILTTKLPGNQDGYSLLILVTAEFTPIQLGLGFTLNGVGGLLGLNRTINVDTLRNGLRDNTLESILFPQNIVQNATTIISNLNNAFPIKKDRFLIGPMAKIGWGTPTLLTIDLGIVIELPSPVLLTILGVIKAVLPDKDKAVLTLQVNFLGVIDFEKKQLSFDASLYNSKILTFALAGDMALRLYWGDNPKFLITAGGFHPKFNPPPMNLPQLRRISLSLVNTNNLKIGAETYFAVTSNSAQFGARVAAMAKAWKIEAVGALWFDVLFQFSPFYFMADMGVMFSVRMFGKERLTIYVDFKLEGPNPWRAQGRAEFRICGVKVRVSFDKTFGQVRTEVIAAVDVWPKLQAAIQHKDNWNVEGPTRIQPMVAYKEVSLLPGEILADPFGTFRFSQKAVPLDITISKFGTAGVNDFQKFVLDPVTAGGSSLPTQSAVDYFARNEFFYMTDDEKLSRESYEKFNSGVRIGNTDELYSEFFTLRAVEYDEIFIDTRYRRRLKDLHLPLAHLSDVALEKHAFANYVTRSPLSDFKNKAPDGGPRKTTVIAAEETNYVLADRNNLTQVPGTGAYLNHRQAEEQLASLLASQPAAAAEYIIVNAFEL